MNKRVGMIYMALENNNVEKALNEIQEAGK